MARNRKAPVQGVGTIVTRGGGKFLREGRTGRRILRLPINGVNFVTLRRY